MITSAIDATNIDENFPKPGISNDSGGFRNNFMEIKRNLTVAKDELDQLITHGVRDDTPVTDFNGNVITNCVLRAVSDCRYIEPELKLTAFDVDYRNGPYQSVTIGANLVISLVNFPLDTTTVNQVGRIRLQLSADATNRKVTFATETALLNYDSAFPFSNPNQIMLTGSTTGIVTIVDIWQVNSDSEIPSIYIKYTGTYKTQPTA